MSNLIPQKIEIAVPDNPFEAVMYLSELSNNLAKLKETIDESIAERTNGLQGLSDENYECVEVFADRKSSELDYLKLQEELPEIAKRCLSIKASDAEKLIGKERLKEIVIEEVGEDAFESVADITITDARKNIPKNLAPNYIREFYKSKGYVVVKK